MANPIDTDPLRREQTALLKAFTGTVRHYWGDWDRLFGGVIDPRNLSQIIYPLNSLLFTGVFLFLCQLGTRRAINDQLRTNGPAQAKLAAWFDVENFPHGDTLNYTYRHLEVPQLQEVICRGVEVLIRKKVLARYRLLGLYYLVAVDGTGVLTYHQRHCPHCLTRTLSKGETLYYHPVLEAKLVTANGLAFSLMTEFIDNTDLTSDKQDCELNAFYRLAQRLKVRFPRLPMCLLLDGLYAGGPTFQLCADCDWKYLVVLREEDLPNLHRSFATVLPHLPNQHKRVSMQEVSSQQRLEHTQQDFRWAEGLSYTDGYKHPHTLNLIECAETRTDPHAQITQLHYKWITNFSLTAHNVDQLANRGARLRWKIENEGFNVQKNSGFQLEHAYSQDPNAGKIFYLLLQLAAMIFQLMRKGSLLRQAFPDGLRTAKNLAFRLLEAWRNLPIRAADFLALANGRFQIRLDSS